MKNLAIQFAELCEIFDELIKGQAVRAITLEKDIKKIANGQITQKALFVAITSINSDEHVLMCHLLVDTSEFSTSGPIDKLGYSTALKRAECVKTAVCQKLREIDCTILGGYIDVAICSPIFGKWNQELN